jgi:hypothetical protein
VGESAGNGLELMRLRAGGHPEPFHLAGEHPGPEAHPLRAPRPLARHVHLDCGAGDGAGGCGERQVLRGVVARIHPHQCDQVAESSEEIGVEVQARASPEGSRGKLPQGPLRRNYAAGGPKRAVRT